MCVCLCVSFALFMPDLFLVLHNLLFYFIFSNSLFYSVYEQSLLIIVTIVQIFTCCSVARFFWKNQCISVMYLLLFYYSYLCLFSLYFTDPFSFLFIFITVTNMNLHHLCYILHCNIRSHCLHVSGVSLCNFYLVFIN